MPFYEFCCKRCNKKYDELCECYDETGKWPKVKCPECGSKSKTKLFSEVHYNFAQPQGTDRWNNGATGHDYRFKHGAPKVKKEREMAEALSHMGVDPYGSTMDADLSLDTGIHDPETRPGLI